MTALAKISPSITKMIRFDHMHLLAVLHGYEPDIPDWRKQAIAEVACLALEVHSQLEEEVFYPALRQAAPDDEVLAQAEPQHDEMRRLIVKLRGLQPQDDTFDATIRELQREAMHHMADEETVLLPLAERLLADRLGELGAEMTRRRMPLLAPHGGELAVGHARAMPVATGLLAAGALATGYLLKKSFESRPH